MMPAYTQEGIATRDRTLRTLGKLVGVVPQWAIDDMDWDALSKRHVVPWTDEEMREQTTMSREEFGHVWDEHRRQQEMESLGIVANGYEEAARELAEKTTRSEIPHRYSMTPLVMTYVADLEAGKNVYIQGAQGSGKTWTACGMLRGWMSRNGGRGLFVTSTDLIAKITSTYGNSGTVLEVVDRYGRCPVLVMDDIGKENPTPNTISMLWHVVNTRYEWGVPTIFTSQFELGELGKRLGSGGDTETASSIVSRIAESCVCVRTGDADLRIGK